MAKPNRRMIRPANLLAAMAGLAGLVGLACATPRFEIPDNVDLEPVAVRESAPLGGASLTQRKQQLARAQRDMVHFHTTLESLHHRRDRNGLVLFSGFLDAYMGLHLEPLLEGKWQNNHPELMALDANLRFAQAEVLIQMRAPHRVQKVINEIANRYGGRGGMLVEFPLGGQSTLKEGLELLSNRKWRG